MKNKKIISLGILLIFFIILKVINPPIIQKISFINYDFYQKVFNRGEVKNITIVDIDEKSIAKIGQFPWRRDAYSKILYNLNQYNPSAIAFDIVFSEEDKQNPKSLLSQLQKDSNQYIDIEVPNTNQIFVDSLAQSKVILPILGEPNDSFIENNSKPKLRVLAKGNDPRGYIYKFKNKITSLEEINAGKLSKVVLARQLTFQTNQELPPFSIAHALRERFPDCFTFCLSTPNSGMMVGSTPETLLRASGTVLETEAVAGSAPRGPSAGRDAHWGKTLLARKKEVHEHRVVIDSILRRLKSIGLENCHEGKPRLLRLANLQHVRTPLRVESHDNIHPFDALAALHPTPAMGGSPREIALPLVRKLENSPRGWYSGITGWIDNRGRGEFVVPIRCGKLSQKSLTLYAGAGVVSGSSPAQEKIETDWKLKAMLDVITGKSDFSGET